MSQSCKKKGEFLGDRLEILPSVYFTDHGELYQHKTLTDHPKCFYNFCLSVCRNDFRKILLQQLLASVALTVRIWRFVVNFVHK